MLTLQKRRRKRPSHPRRVLLPTRIYLAGFMTRGLPLRKRDYAHRHDSARASLRNVDCLHKAMRARAQRGARRKGLGVFFSCYTRLPPCNVITGDLGRGAAALGWRGGWRKEIPSQGDGRCGGVVVVRESVHSVQVGCLGHGLQLTTLLARERGGRGKGDDLSLSYLPFKVMCTNYSILRNCTAVNIIDVPFGSVASRFISILLYFRISSTASRKSLGCARPHVEAGGSCLVGTDDGLGVGTRRQVVGCTLPWICTAGGKIKIK
jgi:hypothetical protein